MRSQENRQLDRRAACRLQILCLFRQFALERERFYQQDTRLTWMTAGVFDAVDMECCAGAENDDDSEWANFEFSTRGVTGAVSPPVKTL